MTKILFVCTGNSVRSQMAEGFARYYAGDQFEIRSAGTYPVGVNPYAIQVMQEVSLDISGQTSDPLSEFSLQDFDCVVTLCDSARASCPVIPTGIELHHWPLPDPAGLIVKSSEIIQAFRLVRHQVEQNVKALLATLTETS